MDSVPSPVYDAGRSRYTNYVHAYVGFLLYICMHSLVAVLGIE